MCGWAHYGEQIPYNVRYNVHLYVHLYVHIILHFIVHLYVHITLHLEVFGLSVLSIFFGKFPKFFSHEILEKFFGKFVHCADCKNLQKKVAEIILPLMLCPIFYLSVRAHQHDTTLPLCHLFLPTHIPKSRHVF